MDGALTHEVVVEGIVSSSGLTSIPGRETTDPLACSQLLA
jgi:hypothetical protein